MCEIPNNRGSREEERGSYAGAILLSRNSPVFTDLKWCLVNKAFTRFKHLSQWPEKAEQLREERLIRPGTGSNMWNDTAMTLTWIAHTQHEHPSHQTAVRESLVCLPSFFMTTLESSLFCPQTEKQKASTIFAERKYLLLAIYHFLLRSQSAGNTLSPHLGKKVFLRHLFCLWMFSVCQHEVWEEAWQGRKSNSFERPNYN